MVVSPQSNCAEPPGAAAEGPVGVLVQAVATRTATRTAKRRCFIAGSLAGVPQRAECELTREGSASGVVRRNGTPAFYRIYRDK